MINLDSFLHINLDFVKVNLNTLTTSINPIPH